jgi:LysR family transcriptional regulator, low CO2-responsive transcriptional regulator
MLTGLKAFHAVAEAGSFTRAAAAIGLSQPTLSSQVALLEATHHISLFDRKHRGVALTPLGQRLFDVTSRIFAAEAEAHDLLQGARTIQKGHLRIAADSAAHVMPALASLRAANPGLTFSMAIDNSTNVLRRLLDYEADIGVMSRQTSDPRIFSIPLKRDRLILFVPSGHALAKAGSVPITSLQGVDIVIREHGSVTREVFEAGLATANVRPGQLVEVQSREAVREAVAAGFGIGVIFESELGGDPAFCPVRVTGADLGVAEYVACLENRRRLAIVKGFLDVVQGKLLRDSRMDSPVAQNGETTPMAPGNPMAEQP